MLVNFACNYDWYTVFSGNEMIEWYFPNQFSADINEVMHSTHLDLIRVGCGSIRIQWHARAVNNVNAIL